MFYSRSAVRKYVLIIIYSALKTYSFICSKKHCIPSNKGKKRARNKSTIITTKYVQNVIKLTQNLLNNLFQESFSWVLSISFTNAFIAFENSIYVWHFSWTINGCWKFILFWHLIILNQNELLYLCLWKGVIFKPRSFCC